MSGTRLQSLDVFRGGTIAAMILVNNPGSAAAYGPLQHAEWHGWTFTDLVFPFFLWIVGVAITFSLSKRVTRGDSRSTLLMHAARRAVVIFAVGLLLNLIPKFDFGTVRIPGVLQRIAICYLCAAAIFLLVRSWKAQVAVTLFLLAVYWALMTLVPVPGCGPGSFSVDCNFARYVDGMLLSGHMWARSKVWDPEGIVSTLPAIATTMFGVFAGSLLALRRSMPETTSWLFFGGNALVFAGMCLEAFMPVNKQLWTVPYALLTAGIAAVVFATCYWLIDGLKWDRFATPFAIYGANALAMFVLSGLFAKLFPGARTWAWTQVFSGVQPEPFGSLLFSLAHVLLFWCIAWAMYKRGWFVRA